MIYVSFFLFNHSYILIDVARVVEQPRWSKAFVDAAIGEGEVGLVFLDWIVLKISSAVREQVVTIVCNGIRNLSASGCEGRFKKKKKKNYILTVSFDILGPIVIISYS